MNTDEMQPEPPVEKKKSNNAMHLVLAFVILALLAATAVYINHVRNTPAEDTSVTPAAVEPNFSLSPPKETLKVGEELTVSVWEDSGTQAVNAVQASLAYSADEFDVTKVDSTASAFDIEAPVTNTPGSLVISRAHQGKITGRQLITQVTFKAKKETSAAKVDFSGKNVLLAAIDQTSTSATETKDILKVTTGGTYNIGAAQ